MHSSKLDKQMYHGDTYTPLPFFLMRQSNKNERKEEKKRLWRVSKFIRSKPWTVKFAFYIWILV